MEITIDLPDEIYEALLEMAAAEGKTLQELIIEIVKLEIAKPTFPEE